MKIVERLSDVPPEIRDAVVVIGTFDGVHIGHQRLISHAVSRAREAGAPCVLFTFRNHPLSVLAPERVPPALSSRDERRRIFSSLGVSLLIEERFTQVLASLSAEEFLSRLVEALAPRSIVVGNNFSFGAGGRGTPEFLAAHGKERGFGVEDLALLTFEGETVSSTRVRALLAAGDVRMAAKLLGRAFSIAGVVMHGDERGRTLGFPTANLLPSSGEACPANGAYAVRVERENGDAHIGVANVGVNPTFAGKERRIEAHLLDFSGNLYGERIVVRFIERLRGERRFPSPEALVAQIREDEKSARAMFAKRTC